MHFLSRTALALLALAATPVVALAQGMPASTSPVTDSLYRRAERLVMAGNGADGRAIVDSLLGVSRAGTFEHAEALYWRARLAETAAEAERGYLRVAVEYPLSPHTEDALLRLGQLEMTRGNRQLALSRFERVATDFPGSTQRARTYFSIARIYLDQNQLPKGCAAVREAQTALRDDEVELRNQITYQAQRCSALSVETPAEPVVPGAPRPAAPAEVAAAAPAVAERPVAAAPAVAEPPVAAAPRPVPTAPAAVRERAGQAAPAAAPAARPMRPGFSVQVAAFDRAEPARTMVDQLRRQGFEARVDADGTWHRVRVGHYPDRAAATAMVKRLDARGIKGYVTGVGGS